MAPFCGSGSDVLVIACGAPPSTLISSEFSFEPVRFWMRSGRLPGSWTWTHVPPFCGISSNRPAPPLVVQLLLVPTAIALTTAPVAPRAAAAAATEPEAPTLQTPSEANTTALWLLLAVLIRAVALTSASGQLVRLPATAPLMAAFTAGSLGVVKRLGPGFRSWIVAKSSNVTKPTSSVEPSAATALLSPTKNCFSQFRIGEQPVPPPRVVLPEVSMM